MAINLNNTCYYHLIKCHSTYLFYFKSLFCYDLNVLDFDVWMEEVLSFLLPSLQADSVLVR